MAAICCEGDPKLYDTGAGTTLVITDGQPVMDEGLENAAYLSLFTSPGWWGNIVSAGSEKLGSRFEEIFSRTLTNATRQDAEVFTSDALAWMKTDGIADSVSVQASILDPSTLALVITIEQGTDKTVIKYAINWNTMAVRAGVA